MIKPTRPELKLNKSETETVSSNESKAEGSKSETETSGNESGESSGI